MNGYNKKLHKNTFLRLINWLLVFIYLIAFFSSSSKIHLRQLVREKVDWWSKSLKYYRYWKISNLVPQIIKKRRKTTFRIATYLSFSSYKWTPYKMQMIPYKINNFSQKLRQNGCFESEIRGNCCLVKEWLKSFFQWPS